jgi:hypothetical protein
MSNMRLITNDNRNLKWFAVITCFTCLCGTAFITLITGCHERRMYPEWRYVKHITKDIPLDIPTISNVIYAEYSMGLKEDSVLFFANVREADVDKLLRACKIGPQRHGCMESTYVLKPSLENDMTKQLGIFTLQCESVLVFYTVVPSRRHVQSSWCIDIYVAFVSNDIRQICFWGLQYM